MTPEEALVKVRGYLTDYLPLDNADEIDEIIEALKSTEWIPVSKQLPKENEYIGDVCKYYLIQDEYGDMYVAHLTKVGWIPMGLFKAIGSEVVAWMPLPKSYEPEREEEE